MRCALAAAAGLAALLAAPTADAQAISAMAGAAGQLMDVLTTGSLAGDLYTRTAEFCDTFGHRQVGTANLEASIDWVVARLQADGFDNVHKEPVCDRIEPHHPPRAAILTWCSGRAAS